MVERADKNRGEDRPFLERLKEMPVGKVVRYALIGSVIAFVFWVGLVYTFWRLANPTGEVSTLWSALEGLSSAATFAIAIGGGLMALIQLSEAVDQRKLAIESRNFEVYNNIFERLMSDEHIEARRWIYLNLPDDPEVGLQQIDEEGHRYIKMVLNAFDHLGFLLQRDWVHDEGILGWVSPIVVKTWEKLGPYVEYEARRRREPDYYEAARHLAEQCYEWRRRHLPEAEVNWLNDAL
ncbi:MAG TPA: hypothetical protein ENI95_12480 [Chloroflexi bacterium]|nr:hypothetical protein [Chloroflexota bacterium]